MSQSNWIFGVLLFAFIVYITTKGELPSYIALFTSKGATTSTATQTPSQAASTAQTVAAQNKVLQGLVNGDFIGSLLSGLKNVPVE
jgi:hypothetical protein